ncbi:hypothetical protein EVAR_90442_1 [Eumeta japonica]|uniref:Uncharacterized protein n=1 Tax=Eumeta variegata TaxID=151549 RepID=A0A4C1SHY4_EUMVA|nr:hypothetical protein EVAR_90442_1 [Eumeta japonica]
MSTKSQSRTEEVAVSHIKRHKTPAENFTVEDGERPLRVNRLEEAGSKAIPTRKTVRRSNPDAQHKVQEWERKLPSSPLEIEEGSILPTISAL